MPGGAGSPSPGVREPGSVDRTEVRKSRPLLTGTQAKLEAAGTARSKGMPNGKIMTSEKALLVIAGPLSLLMAIAALIG